MADDLTERLDAVERALTDGETAVDDLSDAADVERRLTELETRAETVDERLTELEAAVQAVRGYVGGVRAVNRDVERRADAALATAEAVAEQVSDGPTVDDLDLPAAETRHADAGVDDDSTERTEDDDLASRLRRVL
ncbi:hypothetical protein SAMN04487949_0878 [Halogranum gelatinilyticum]|uniref:DUF7310 domain-containing protein n=1 Tax=Halogranum gelatinilyticum TaxID=660521 RepID=A0A1G9QKM0_9EURY|nr:hypothetical protein [Halogranum gelatinilyticum]SDM10825.1 hypothetical protein SAMN04487949_0878 [Halogranum gelatinilyticum]